MKQILEFVRAKTSDYRKSDYFFNDEAVWTYTE